MPTASAAPVPPAGPAPDAALRSDHAAAGRAPLVEVADLTRRYGRRTALAGVSFTLGAGECLALFGPNGAGKTTLLRLLGGLARPTRGEARLLGHPLPGDAATRAITGYISHATMCYPALTALENVAFAARTYGMPNAEQAARDALTRLRIADRAASPLRALSRGLQQRVAIARALVHRPRVLLLDEPYTGLDEVGARAFTDALRAARDAGAALVLVTHHLGEGLALATRAVVMREGRFVHEEPVDRASPPDVTAFASRYRALVGAEVEGAA